mmetsp:Transcript_67996/g.199005  ORF Transcript_67996/g.199005 Transcript_67996/m.199005 type:complete len:258 (+) Transcript_67996:511-1284(+)
MGAIFRCHLPQRSRERLRRGLQGPQEGAAPAGGLDQLGVGGLVGGLRQGDHRHASHEALLKAVEARVRHEGVRSLAQHRDLLHRRAQGDVGRHLRQPLLVAVALQEVQGVGLAADAEDAVVAFAELAHGFEERPPEALAVDLPSRACWQAAVGDRGDVDGPAVRHCHGAHRRIDDPVAARGRRRKLRFRERVGQAARAHGRGLGGGGAGDVRRGLARHAADGRRGEALVHLVGPARRAARRQWRHQGLRGRHEVRVL